MNFAKKAWFVFLVVAFILSACGAAETQSQDEINAMLTQGVGTMVAGIFGTQTAMYTPPTDQPTASPIPSSTFPPVNTPTLFPTPTHIYYTPTLGTLTPGTPTVTGTVFTPTIDPMKLGVGCNNLAFIRDVTIPAGTVVEKGRDFTKTWKVQNIGTCDWMYQYQLVLLSGDAYGGKTTKIQRRVTVNDWSELSVNLTAPKNPGTYTAYWRLADSNGAMFGATLVVSFKVAEPTAVPTATPTSTPTTAAPTEAPTDVPTEAPTQGP